MCVCLATNPISTTNTTIIPSHKRAEKSYPFRGERMELLREAKSTSKYKNNKKPYSKTWTTRLTCYLVRAVALRSSRLSAVSRRDRLSGRAMLAHCRARRQRAPRRYPRPQRKGRTHPGPDYHQMPPVSTPTPTQLTSTALCDG